MPIYEMFLNFGQQRSPSEKALDDDIEALLGQINGRVSANYYGPETSKCIDHTYLPIVKMCYIDNKELPWFKTMLEGILDSGQDCEKIKAYISEITERAYHYSNIPEYANH